MAKTTTLLDIYEGARRLADQETTLLRFPKADVVSDINKGIAEWWDIVVSSLGAQYCGKSVTVTLLANSQTVTLDSLASDFFKVDRLYLGTNNTDRQKLDPVRPEDEDLFLNKQASKPTHYGLDRTNLYVYPVSDRAYTLLCRYIPVAPVLVEDEDELDTVNAWGDVYAETYAARRMCIKDGDVAEAQTLLADLAGLTKRIQALASNRDISGPIRIADTRPHHGRLRRGRIL